MGPWLKGTICAVAMAAAVGLSGCPKETQSEKNETLIERVDIKELDCPLDESVRYESEYDVLNERVICLYKITEESYFVTLSAKPIITKDGTVKFRSIRLRLSDLPGRKDTVILTDFGTRLGVDKIDNETKDRQCFGDNGYLKVFGKPWNEKCKKKELEDANDLFRKYLKELKFFEHVEYWKNKESIGGGWVNDK